jgi:hypothetical protein
MSHVIEHIPKYSLLWVVDTLYRAPKADGTLMLRTPNMESPCANSSLYVTLAHEYGNALRRIFLKENEIKHRLFGVNRHGIFGSELVVTAKRGAMPPLFDPKYQ